jgi:putative PIN family toxin of toxin-antitoxin system
MRVVLDTNVLVSGMLLPHDPPAQIITLWLAGDFTLLYMPAMLDELEDVLNRTWLKARLVQTSDRIPDFLEAVSVLGRLVVGYVNVDGAVLDPFDEMFLRCVLLGNAHYLVTGDKHLLDLIQFGGAEIVPPSQFLQILDERNS